MICLTRYAEVSTPVLARILQRIVPGMCSLALALLLIACGGGSGTSKPTPTAVPTATPTPSPVPVKSLITYAGGGYTIEFPRGWKVSREANGLVTFNDPQGIAYLSIATALNPHGAISAPDLVDLGLQVFRSQAKNYQRLEVAPTTVVGGETWSQGAATGDVTRSGQPSPETMKVVVIADNHPPPASTTEAFTIAYGTGWLVFDLAFRAYFQGNAALIHIHLSGVVAMRQRLSL
jgi:hypothetical protein